MVAHTEEGIAVVDDAVDDIAYAVAGIAVLL